MFLGLLFQSTLPVRGATHLLPWGLRPQRHFNPRSPYGERLVLLLPRLKNLRISIHAPRTGSDCHDRSTASRHLYFNPRSPYGERPSHIGPSTGQLGFQSTLPVRGATMCARNPIQSESISIHAPRRFLSLPVRGAWIEI